MLFRHTFLSLFSLIVVTAFSAEAGVLANNGWTPSGCGPAPAVSQLDLSSLDAYNKSVEAVNTYRKNSHAYVNCLIQDGNNDIQIISKSAKAAQQAAHDADDKILGDEKAADKKFPK